MSDLPDFSSKAIDPNSDASRSMTHQKPPPNTARPVFDALSAFGRNFGPLPEQVLNEQGQVVFPTNAVERFIQAESDPQVMLAGNFIGPGGPRGGPPRGPGDIIKFPSERVGPPKDGPGKVIEVPSAFNLKKKWNDFLYEMSETHNPNWSMEDGWISNHDPQKLLNGMTSEQRRYYQELTALRQKARYRRLTQDDIPTSDPTVETPPQIWDTPPENVPPKSGFSESTQILDRAMAEGNRPRLATSSDQPRPNPGRIDPAAIERALNAPTSPEVTLQNQNVGQPSLGRDLTRAGAIGGAMGAATHLTGDTPQGGGGEGEGGGPGGMGMTGAFSALSNPEKQPGDLPLPANNTDVALGARMRSEPVQQEIEGIAHPPREIPQNYLDRIKKIEGFNAVPFWDVKQWTVGWGTKAKDRNERPSIEELQKRFDQEIASAARAVDSVNPNLDEGTRAALTSLTFNVGPGWTRHGLGQIVREGNPQKIAAAMQAYANVSGKHNPAIAERRRTEAEWISPRPPANIPHTARHQRHPTHQTRHPAPGRSPSVISTRLDPI